VKKKDFSRSALQAYEKELWDHLGNELKGSYFLQKLASHPWIFDQVLHKAAKKPKIIEALSATLTGEKPTTKVLNLGLIKNLLF